MAYIGQSLKRFEDPRLLTGQGAFLDDLTFPGYAVRRACCAAPTPMPPSGPSIPQRPATRLGWSPSSPPMT